MWHLYCHWGMQAVNPLSTHVPKEGHDRIHVQVIQLLPPFDGVEVVFCEVELGHPLGNRLLRLAICSVQRV